MRVFFIGAVALGIVGCSSKPSENTASENNASAPVEQASSTSILDKLAASDASVCVEPEVEQTLFRALMPHEEFEARRSYEQLIASGASFELEAASMSGRDQSIREVSCEGTLPTWNRLPVEYRVRPAASGDHFTVSFNIPNASFSDVDGALWNALEARLKEAGLSKEDRTPQAPAAVSQASPSEAPAPDDAGRKALAEQIEKLDDECRFTPSGPEKDAACEKREQLTDKWTSLYSK